MTGKLDVVRRYIDAVWSNPPASLVEEGMKTLADDFQNFDEAGNVVMDKQSYIGMGQLMCTSFSDFKWVLRDLQEADDGVLMSGHFEGTHTGDLDLTAMGMGLIPASGNKIVWDEVTVKWSVEGDKITAESAYAGATGMAPFLAKLGVAAPKS